MIVFILVFVLINERAHTHKIELYSQKQKGNSGAVDLIPILLFHFRL